MERIELIYIQLNKLYKSNLFILDLTLFIADIIVCSIIILKSILVHGLYCICKKIATEKLLLLIK